MLLSARSITKTFPGVRALDAVNLEIRAGEVHALVGENGAGKSTLIKVLTGVHAPDAGVVHLRGRPVRPASPREAEALGISTVYQEVNLIPTLSVAENLCLGRFPTRLRTIRWRETRRRARAALNRLGMRLDVGRPLSDHSLAIQQMVAIARALDTQARVLILDEPTSSLDDKETDELFAVMDRLRGDGIGVLFITHFIDQVYRISDRITVLRNGRLVGRYDTKAVPRLELIAAMVGRDVSVLEAQERDARRRRHAPSSGEPLVRVEGLGKNQSASRLDFTIEAGRTVGLAGLLGSGRSETARLLFGVDQADHGRLVVDGKPARPRSPRQAIELGFAMTPEDRKVEGIIPDLSVRENIILALQSRRGIWRRIAPAGQREVADRYIAALDIRTPSREQPVRNLSGGNQQKVLLARWLATDPRLFILDEPTRGIDVGAKAEIERLVHELTAKGMSILFISSEWDEVTRTSQRVIVLRDRRQVGALDGDDVNEHAIAALIARSDEGHRAQREPGNA